MDFAWALQQVDDALIGVPIFYDYSRERYAIVILTVVVTDTIVITTTVVIGIERVKDTMSHELQRWDSIRLLGLLLYL